MTAWTVDDVAWHEFEADKIKPELVSLVKAACMVEHNGYDYARYLCEVFADDLEFQGVIKQWAEEEVKHGIVLRKWAELADPGFDFDKSFEMFKTGYKLPVNVKSSVRGSGCGELIARCVVETGTSIYYTAMKEYSDEPVLKAVSAKIAADEFRHYKLFYDHLNNYIRKENIGFLRRVGVALGRIAESEDDELAYAFFAAHHNGVSGQYNRRLYTKKYFACVMKLYRKPHIDRMTSMVFKAVGIRTNTILNKIFSYAAWNTLRLRAG